MFLQKQKKRNHTFIWVCLLVFAHRDRQHGHIMYTYWIVWISMLLLMWLRLWLLLFFCNNFENLGTQLKLATVQQRRARLSSEYSVTFQLNNSKSTRAYTHTHSLKQCIAFTLACDWKCPKEMANYTEKKTNQPAKLHKKIVIVSLSRNLNFQPIWVYVCMFICDLLIRS